MREIIKNLFHVGDSGCSVYLVNTNNTDGLVLIDCGMSLRLIKGIRREGLEPQNIKHCFITHCHIDHIGACNDIKNYVNSITFYAHKLDSEAIENPDMNEKTAASWYGVSYQPVKIHRKLKKEKEVIKLGEYEFECIHTPGHTPGSISILVNMHGKKVLFGQDIHGPFYKSFGSNLKDYQDSMEKLLNLNADILCEGHFGVIKPANEVKKYIKNYMEQNKP